MTMSVDDKAFFEFHKEILRIVSGFIYDWPSIWADHHMKIKSIKDLSGSWVSDDPVEDEKNLQALISGDDPQPSLPEKYGTVIGGYFTTSQLFGSMS